MRIYYSLIGIISIVCVLVSIGLGAFGAMPKTKCVTEEEQTIEQRVSDLEQRVAELENAIHRQDEDE